MDQNRYTMSDCVVPPQAREAANEELHQLLMKVGSNTNPGTSTGDDEAAPAEATTELYEDPKQVETDPPEEPLEHTETVRGEHNKVRSGVLGKTNISKPSADSSEQKLIGQQLAHGSSGAFTTHSVHLRPKSVEKISHPMSLGERVRKLTGSF